MKLTLINHACCKIQSDSIGILCDPWVDGPAFNFGWDLLIPTPMNFDEIMEGVSHVWISHEHPDHFSVPFLIRLAKTHKDKVVVLFQKTRDHRVLNFCQSQGLRVQELDDRVPTKLNGELSVICGVSDFYDSWLSISDGKTSILNLNDCHTRNDKDVEKIVKYIPRPDVLLSQFSYASWKGGRENSQYRAMAAQNKLEAMARQIRLLKPTFTVPFASMVYFSNEENNYLNDLVNTPQKAAMVIREAGCEPVVLYPGDGWQVDGANWDNSSALLRYEQQYAQLDKLPLRKPGTSASNEELQAAFKGYQERIFSKNSRWLIWLISRLSFLHAFEPVTVELTDTGALFSMSVLEGLRELKKGELVTDVKMHSSSFLFLLKNEFGFDTLMVNGRFESTTGGFSKMTKSLAIGSLNAMGLSLSPSLLYNFQVIIILLRILAGVLSKLKQSGTDKNGTQVNARETRQTTGAATQDHSHADLVRK